MTVMKTLNKKKKKNEPLKSTLINTLTGVTDFSKYKTLTEQNRDVDELQVKKLMESFEEWGTASARVVIIRTSAFSGTTEQFKADGNHSIVAAQRLGLPLNVQIVKLAEDTPLNVTKYIAALNNNNKAWSTNNFLTAFASNGITEYKKLEKIKKKYGFTITDLLYIFLGNGGAKENKMFKSGNLKFIDEVDSMELLNQVIRVKHLIPNKAFIRRSLYKMMRIAKDYKKFADVIIRTAKAMETAQVSFSENESEFYDHLVKLYQAEFKTK